MRTSFERKEDEVPIPHGALPLFIGGGDRFSGEGVPISEPFLNLRYSNNCF